jgi:membrane-associated phospholipid phosphatase
VSESGRSVRWIWLGAASAVLFLVLSATVLSGPVQPFDHSVHTVVAGVISPTVLDALRFVGRLGDPTTLVVVGVIALVLYRAAKRAIIPAAIFLAVAPAVGAGTAWIIGRPRPEGAGLGFPSGHVFGSIVVYGLIAAILSGWVRNAARWRCMITVVTAALVSAVGVSRIALNAHSASDVGGAIFLGLAYLAFGGGVLRLDSEPVSERRT